MKNRKIIWHIVKMVEELGADLGEFLISDSSGELHAYTVSKISKPKVNQVYDIGRAGDITNY